MRKRRAFADKELETVMLEREQQQLEADKIKHLQGLPAGVQSSGSGLPPPVCTPMDGTKIRQLVRQQNPRDFLQRIFPTVNPNVLELVWQGCGGNLERAIEQIVSSSSMSNMHAAHMAQQVALQHRIFTAQMAAVSNANRPPTKPMSAFSQAAVVKNSEAKKIETPAVPHGLPIHVLGHPMAPHGMAMGHPAVLGLYAYQTSNAASQAKMQTMLYPGGSPLPMPLQRNSPNSGEPSLNTEQILAQKSAFTSKPLSSRDPADFYGAGPESSSSPSRSSTCSSRNSSLSEAASPSSDLSITEPNALQNKGLPNLPDATKFPIKFSVERIIGK